MDGNTEISPALREANPDVVVVDGLSEGNCALESLPEIRREAGDALVLLAVADDEVADTARSGRARRGRVHVAEPGRRRARRPRTGPERSASSGSREGVDAERPAAHSPLTTRELETLRWVAEGHTNAWIARKLWVTEQTVKFHLTNIYRKLGVANRTEASRYALVNDLIPRPGHRLSAATATLQRSGDAVNG